MGYDNDGLKEAAQSVAWWLAPENAEAKRELRERNEALAAWLDMVETRVAEKLKEVEAQEEARAKV